MPVLAQKVARLLRGGRTLVCLSLLAVSLSGAPKIRVGIAPWYPNAPLNVAEAKGFWQELGLEVEIRHFMTTQEVVAALSAGRLELGVDMIGSWVSQIAEGTDLVVLGELDWSHGGDKVVIKKGTKLADLKGGSLGVYFDSLPVTFFAQHALEREQCNLSDFRIVEVEDVNQLKALFLAGKLKAVALYEPQATQAVLEGGGEVLASTADFRGIMPEGVAATRSALARMSDEDLTKFWRGWFRAVRWSADPANRVEFYRIIRQRTYENDEAGDEAAITAGLGNVLIHPATSAREIHGENGSLRAWVKEAGEFLKRGTASAATPDPAKMLHVEPILAAAAAEQAGP